MLFVRLLLIGEEGVGKRSLLKLLQTSQVGDSENQNGNTSSLRFADKKVKVETLVSKEILERLAGNSVRVWNKIQGIIFVIDRVNPSATFENIQIIYEKLKQQQILSKFNILVKFFVNKCDQSASALPSTITSFCKDNSIEMVEVQAKNKSSNAIRAVESLVQQISANNRGSPKVRRRSSRQPQFDNEPQHDIIQPGQSISGASGQRSINATLSHEIPTATSEQLAQILTNTPKKSRRRRSFLEGLKNASKKRKKRRESLLDQQDSDSDRDASDSESDSGYSSGNNSSMEELEGYFSLDSIMEFILFSPSPLRENFIENFLYVINSFLDPVEFIKQLVIRWDTNIKEVKAQVILRNRIVAILYNWLSIIEEDCFPKEAFLILDQFIDQTISKSESVSSSESLVLLWFTKQRKPKSEAKSTSSQDQQGSCEHDRLLSPRAGQIPLAMNSEANPQCIYKIYTPLEVASQLTLIEHNRFVRIQLSELYNTNWTKEGKETVAKNLLYFIHCSNNTTNWIQHLVLSEPDIKERARIIKWCISLLQKCKELTNYSAVMAILGALQSCAVDRLKATWEEVGPKGRKKIDQIFDMMVRENYKEYRSLLKHSAGPCVPFPGMWLSDLMFMESGNAWTKVVEATAGSNEAQKQKLLNLSKIRMISKIYKDIHKFQNSNYLLIENKDVQSLLRNLPTLDEEAAYNVSIELEPVLSEAEKLERKRLALNTNIDLLKCSKFEQVATNIQSIPEMIEVVDKWNKKLRDELTHKENFCHSEALEIIFLKLCSFQTNNLPQATQRDLYSKLNVLFSFCLVGDSSKHQQLLEFIRKFYCVSTDQQAAFKKLIKCFKIPTNYRELSTQLNQTQASIIKLKEQLSILEPNQVAYESEHKEHQFYRKCLDYHKKIITLQKRKETLVQSKDDRKMKILSQYNDLYQTLISLFTQINATNNSTEWSGELVSISQQLQQSESLYINEKKKYATEKDQIANEKKILQQERQKLLDRLAKVEKKLEKLDGSQTNLESNWQNYQQQFSSSKLNFVQKTDDLMNLLDEAEQRNKTTTYLQATLQDFQQFFLSVVRLESANGEAVNPAETSCVTKQQLEEQRITLRESKKYFLRLLSCFKHFEGAIGKLRDEIRKDNETLDAIVKMQLNPEVLHREFPQFNELTEKSKFYKKELIRLKKEFVIIEKQHIADRDLLEIEADEAVRCKAAFQTISALFAELLPEQV